MRQIGFCVGFFPPMMFLLFFFPETVDVITVRHEVCSTSNAWLVPLYVTPPVRKRKDSYSWGL